MGQHGGDARAIQFRQHLGHHKRTRPIPESLLPHEQLKTFTKNKPKKAVKKFLSVLGPLDVDGSTRKKLEAYLQTGDNGQEVKFTNDDATIDKKVRGLVHQIMCLPEFQLN